RIVAVGNYVRIPGKRRAEVAFAVADDFRARGLGTRILEQLARRARAHGIDEFVAFVLPGNNAMTQVFSASGFEVVQTLAGCLIEERLQLDDTALLERR